MGLKTFSNFKANNLYKIWFSIILVLNYLYILVLNFFWAKTNVSIGCWGPALGYPWTRGSFSCRFTIPLDMVVWFRFFFLSVDVTFFDGFVFHLGSSQILWKTKKQDMVFLSSAKTEYSVMNDVMKELKRLKELLQNLGFDHREPRDCRETKMFR